MVTKESEALIRPARAAGPSETGIATSEVRAFSAEPRHVFVVGLDDFNRRKLDVLGANGRLVFHPLLSLEELTTSQSWSLEAVLAKALQCIEGHRQPADAIIGYWDFPVSLIVPILCRRLGLVSPCLESVLKCEHKYWSRLEQRDVAAEHIPAFQAVDPFDDESIAGISLAYPFWLKPVKSYASHLGFCVRNRADLDRAIAAMRQRIRDLGDPFNQFLGRADIPDEIASTDGNHCIAEAIVSGRQCTLEGFVCEGNVVIYGVVDSIRHANRSTFSRYEYPSRLPRSVTRRMADIAKRVITRIGLDSSPFNIEFFWDRKRDKLWLLEINPRISQSHGDLFEKVDGVPHHRVIVDLALGRSPEWQAGSGPFRCAGKFFLRRFSDARVTRVPTEDEIEAAARAVPGMLLEVHVSEGMCLSDLPAQEQDSYSYIYALLFIGADDRGQLMENYRRCLEMLHFGFLETANETRARDGVGRVRDPQDRARGGPS